MPRDLTTTGASGQTAAVPAAPEPTAEATTGAATGAAAAATPPDA